MPIKVFELEQGKERNSVRGKILEFLKKNPDLAYTLKEIYTFCINEDKSDNNYKTNPKTLYKLTYNYLRDFAILGLVIHKGNFYYYKKEVKIAKK